MNTAYYVMTYGLSHIDIISSVFFVSFIRVFEMDILLERYIATLELELRDVPCERFVSQYLRDFRSGGKKYFSLKYCMDRWISNKSITKLFLLFVIAKFDELHQMRTTPSLSCYIGEGNPREQMIVVVHSLCFFIACDAGLYGVDCLQTCHCSGGSACDVFSGECPGECESGWSGPSCQGMRIQNIKVSKSTSSCCHALK